MGQIHRILSSKFNLVVEEFGEGPAVIYAHGLGSNRHDIKIQWESVAHKFRVITFDQRGHGDSTPVTNPDDYNPQSMGEDIATIMDVLHLKKAIVGGVSMGACTSLFFALSHPDRVEALLQTGPAIGEQVSQGMQSLLSTANLLEQ
jgi:pimeloyl-ACP methyl ester carboxylesterase